MQSTFFNYFAWQWNAALLLFFYLYSKHLFKKFPRSLALALAYTILQTYSFTEYTEHFQPYGSLLNSLLCFKGIQALLMIFISIWVIEFVHIKEKWLAYLCITNIVVTLLLYPFDIVRNWAVGLSVNPAMNGAITATTLPFLFTLDSVFIFPLLALAVLCIILSNSTTPLMGLFAALFLPQFFYSKKKIYWVVWAVVVAFVAVSLKPDLINGTDRVPNYIYFLDKWKVMFHPIIGAGNGSFNVWGPTIGRDAQDGGWFWRFFQNNLNIKNYSRTLYLWQWMHSDILQTLWELGVIGFLLWVNAIIRLLYRVKNNAILFGAALAWLATATLYYPLHWPIQLFLGLAIISFAIKNEDC
jgi:hypothetical protein